MKQRRLAGWIATGLLLAVAGWLWISRLAAPDRRPADFSITALTVIPTNAVAVRDPERATRLDKAPDLIERARNARERPGDPLGVEAARDRVARQILDGLRARVGPDTGASRAPLRGQPRDRGRRGLDAEQQAAIDAVADRIGPGGSLQMDGPSGTLRWLRGDLSFLAEGNPAYAAARERADYAGMAMATVSSLARLMRIRDPDAEWVAQDPDADELGMIHVRLNRQHHGFPIDGAQVVVHFSPAGIPVGIGGAYAATPAGLDRPVFSLDDAGAIERVRAAVNAVGPPLVPPTVTRLYYWNPQVSPVPAYRVELVPSVGSGWRVYLAASDGSVLRVTPTVYRAAAVGGAADLLGQSRPVHSWQQGSEFLAIDTSLPMYDAARSQPPVYTNMAGAICVFDVGQRDVEVALREGVGYARANHPNAWDPTVVSVMNHFREIYRYYEETHQRRSFDGRGINITGLIHARFKDSQGRLYQDNAFFNPNLNLMVFGDGEQHTAPGMLPAALDIAAHELTHGVVDNAAAFRYENQPGALHEHMADFFACMVDRDDWLLGEDTMGSLPHAAWRDLSNPANPNVKEPGPKTMAEYRNLPNTPEGDLGGVHVNSTIPSYAAFLFADGPGGLGRARAERIVYRALTRYMTQYSAFIDYRRAAVAAATDLHPGGTEAGVVAAAFDAVGILDGEATPPPTPVPATTGDERVVFLRAERDPWFNLLLGYSFFVMDAQQFEAVSFNLLQPVRPAVSGDGTWALYVGEDHNVYWTDGSATDEPLTDTGDIRTIALSKDLTRVAFTTMAFDHRIHVLDVAADAVLTGEIRIPNRNGDDLAAGFADVLAFNCIGDVLYFDAWTEGSLAQADYGCWGLFALRVKDLQCRLLLPLSPGLQVGNPSPAHTLPGYLVADYVFTTNGQVTLGMVSLDLGQNRLGVLLSGLPILATPSLRGDDRRLVFSTWRDGLHFLHEAMLSADRDALVPGAPSALLWSVAELVYPVAFRTGSYAPPAGRLEVSPASLDFGIVATGGTLGRTLEVRNTGNADLELIGASLEGAATDAFRLVSPLDARLAPGRLQSLEVSFTPASAGPHVATLRFRTTAPGQPDIALGLAGTGDTGPASDPWQEVWQDFEDRYSYFGHKGVDWDAVLESERPGFQGLAPAQFGQRLNDVLQILHDWHVNVRLPDGTWLGYRGEYPRNHPLTLYAGYTGGSDYANLRDANVLYHARLTGNIAHLVVDTLDQGAFSTITDADLDAVFATHAGAEGWILDLRNNSGGNEANAARIASRFIHETRTYGYVRYRIPKSRPHTFEPFLEKTLQPAASGPVLQPVAVLIGQRCMSSAEWFTLMMQVCPNAVLMGDRTRGASGHPEARTLQALDIEYSISRWIAYDAEQRPFEDHGIAPAIAVDPGRSFDDALQRDYVLEAALDYLAWRRQFGGALPHVSGRSDRDGDGQSDIAEYLAGTDPTRADDRFGLDPRGIRRAAGGGIELRWSSRADRRYRVLRASAVHGPYQAVAHGIVATPPTNLHLDASATGPGPWFYRLELVP
ncbi:MAG: M4 family metallopeptidase [Verrucomicrobiae bacterium]|nr:M4 family metallopeptidase [Verrucomicrobiae bacterium]